MVDSFIRKKREKETIEAIKSDVCLKFGPGTYYVEVRTDVDIRDQTWLVCVAWFSRDKVVTGTITPEQATVPRNRQILCHYLYEEAKKQRLLEFMMNGTGKR